MKKMILIFAGLATLSATPALAREPAPQSDAELKHELATAMGRSAAAQQFIADHALVHGKDVRGWPCGKGESSAVAMALKTTALALATSPQLPAPSDRRHISMVQDCDRCDDCPDCEACADKSCSATVEKPGSGKTVDCVDCPDQAGFV